MLAIHFFFIYLIFIFCMGLFYLSYKYYFDSLIDLIFIILQKSEAEVNIIYRKSMFIKCIVFQIIFMLN